MDWAKLLLVAGILVGVSSSAHGWSLETHVWIADQVISDVSDDGAVTIDGNSYPVPPDVAQAIRSRPGHYRMGNIGPDGFPDPLVGQTTTHPGVESGWQTGDWLRHLLSDAQTPEEIAVAYGFVGHAAGDIFAHTYVNMYAGDIFSLTDGEREVELRHFVLEKFIESYTPTNWINEFSTPADYLRDRLIFNSEVQKQYLKSGTGLHLVAMNLTRKAVREFGNGVDDIIKELTEFSADRLKEAVDVQIELATAKLTFKAAEVGLKGARIAYRINDEIRKLKLKILNEAKDIIDEYPELISIQEKIIAKQAGIIAEAIEEVGQLIGKIGEIEKTLNQLKNKLSGIPRKIVKEVCDEVCKWTPWPLNKFVCDLVCKNIEKANDIWDELNNRITGFQNNVIDLRTKHSNAVAREAAAVARKAQEIAKRIAIEKELAATKVALAGYEAAAELAEFERKAAKATLDAAQAVYDEAKQIRDKIEAELKKVSQIIDFAKDFIDKYNLVTLYLENWENDINKAGREYIRASQGASLRILHSQGGVIDPYKKWLECWGPVFSGVPGAVTNTICETKNRIEELKGKLDDVIDGLPEPIRWLLFPTREVRKRAEAELRPVLKEAFSEIVAFITDRQTAEFLELLGNPENATRAKLDSVYRNDETHKNLLEFERVSDFVLRDLSLRSDGSFDPDNFIVARNSVVLAKLSLLSSNELNRLFRAYVSDARTVYGPNLYGGSNGRFSLVLDMVRNIDGNHQWQAYGLPFPRKLGVAVGAPVNFHYGYDFFQDSMKGFRLWVDPNARDQVFARLFPGPGVLGSLGERQELQYPDYPFEACEDNPYPRTQNDDGRIVNTDSRCLSAWNPVRWILSAFENGRLEKMVSYADGR